MWLHRTKPLKARKGSCAFLRRRRRTARTRTSSALRGKFRTAQQRRLKAICRRFAAVAQAVEAGARTRGRGPAPARERAREVARCTWEERCARTRAQGDRPLRGRCESELIDASSGRTIRQVDHVPDAQALADLAQPRASGCEESAEQPVALELLEPSLPGLSTTTQPLKDPGQLRRNRGLSLAKEATRVIDQI